MLFMAFISSCSFSMKEKKTYSDHVKEELEYWIGRTIVLPQIGIDTICLNSYKRVDKNQTDFRLLVYMDSTACTTCNLDLFLWDELARDINKDDSLKLTFLFYCQPQYNGTKAIRSLIKRDQFKMPLFIDNANQIGKLNGFIKHFPYQCFLLGKSNQVLAMGDPSQNLELWRYYKELINDSINKLNIN